MARLIFFASCSERCVFPKGSHISPVINDWTTFFPFGYKFLMLNFFIIVVLFYQLKDQIDDYMTETI